MKVTKEFIRPDSGKPASVALGLFDGIHIGHTKVLQQALKNRELAPCVFTYTISSFVPQIKKNYLALMPDEQKCAILERMGFEQVVMPDFSSFKDMEPEEFVEKMLIQGMGAKELSCGYDFTFGKGARARQRRSAGLPNATGSRSMWSNQSHWTGSRSAPPASARRFWRERWTRPAGCWDAASACG